MSTNAPDRIETTDPMLAFAIARTRGRQAVRGPDGQPVIYRLAHETIVDPKTGTKRKGCAYWARLGKLSDLSDTDTGPAIRREVLEVVNCPLCAVAP